MTEKMGICEGTDEINKGTDNKYQKEEIQIENNGVVQGKDKINKENPNEKNENKNIEKENKIDIEKKEEGKADQKSEKKEEKQEIKEKDNNETKEKEKEKEKNEINKKDNDIKKQAEPNEKELKNKEGENKLENEQKKDVEKDMSKENKENKKENKTEKKNKDEKESKQKIKMENIITKDIIPRGLNNIGSTCYMNSVIQCLYHIFDLSNELLLLYKSKILNESLLKKLPMTYAFLDVIYDLSFDKKSSISPYNFKKIIGNNKSFRNFEANDSKNLTLYILDMLNRELNQNKIISENELYINKIRNYKEEDAKSMVNYFNENQNSLIGDLFNGLKSTNYTCLKCKNCIKNYQIFNIVSCNIEKTFMNKYNKSGKRKIEFKVDVLECFKTEEEPNLFNGDNQLFCEKCNKLEDGESCNKICISPKILILFLDRGINNRFNCDVDFPEILDINNFLEVKDKKYELIGVIEHLGQSGESGHFIANCKHFDGNWYIFSDSSIFCTKNKYIKYGLPYLVFYRMQD